MSFFSRFTHSRTVITHPADVTVRVRRVVPHATAREERIDRELEQTFPASDPPSWNMGVSRPDEWR
ncbi:MAG TPA: hypothetical protein VF271_02885 [Rhodanobacteraceae bacterium]